MLLDRLHGLGLLLTTPAAATQQIVAANVGITLQLIAQPEADVGQSHALRETVLAGVIAASALRPGAGAAADTAIAEAAAELSRAPALHCGDEVLSAGERALLTELLNRLAVC